MTKRTTGTLLALLILLAGCSGVEAAQVAESATVILEASTTLEQVAAQSGNPQLAEAARVVSAAAKSLGDTATKAVAENRGITPTEGLGGLAAALLAIAVPILTRNGKSNERKARLEEQQRVTVQRGQDADARIRQLEQLLATVAGDVHPAALPPSTATGAAPG